MKIHQIPNTCVSLVSKVTLKKMPTYNWPALPNRGNVLKWSHLGCGLPRGLQGWERGALFSLLSGQVRSEPDLR